MNAHFDVAAYALGVLDERDADRFEQHLADCAACGVELDSMMPVVDLLAEVDAPSLVAAEESRKDGLVLQQMITTVGRERKRKRGRQLLSLAAAAILLVALTGGALVAGGRWLSPNTGPGGGQAFPTASQGVDTWKPLPEDNPAVGGQKLPGDEQLDNTDPRTGVQAFVGIGTMAWGTQLSLMVSKVQGPRTCKLVAIRTDSSQETLSSWTVPEKGYGTAANPQPLMLQAATALPRKDIAYIQIQAAGADGNYTPLVTVPKQ
ncbi:MAG TPA: zf-HC2 domain-containing protein [Catenuloplanes sp.]|jgi:hypothetical protein